MFKIQWYTLFIKIYKSDLFLFEKVSFLKFFLEWQLSYVAKFRNITDVTVMTDVTDVSDVTDGRDGHDRRT